MVMLNRYITEIITENLVRDSRKLLKTREILTETDFQNLASLSYIPKLIEI